MLGRRKSGRISVLPKSSAVQSQEKELVKAVHEMKEFRLSSDFKYLEIDADKCCLNSPLDRIARQRHAVPKVAEYDTYCLSISYQDSDDSFSVSSFPKNGHKQRQQMVK